MTSGFWAPSPQETAPSQEHVQERPFWEKPEYDMLEDPRNRPPAVAMTSGEAASQVTAEFLPVGIYMENEDIPWMNTDLPSKLATLAAEQTDPQARANCEAAIPYATFAENDPRRTLYYYFGRMLADDVKHMEFGPVSIAAPLVSALRLNLCKNDYLKRQVYGMSDTRSGLERDSFAHDLVTSPVLTNILGHKALTNSEQDPALTQADIDENRFGSIGISLLLDHLFESGGVDSSQQIELVQLDPRATLYYLARGGSGQISHRTIIEVDGRPEYVEKYVVVVDLLLKNHSAKELLDIFCEPSFTEVATKIAHSSVPRHYDESTWREHEIPYNIGHNTPYLLKAIVRRGGHENPAIDLIHQNCGEAYLSLELFNATDSLVQSFTDEQGNVDTKGAQKQFQKRLNEVREFIKSDPDVADIEALFDDNALDTQLFKFALGWRFSDFSAASTGSLRKRISDLRDLSPEQLTSRHAPSGDVILDRVNQKEVTVSSDMRDRITTLHNAIHTSMEKREIPMSERLSESINQLLARAQEQLDDPDNADNQKFIRFQYDKLQKLAGKDYSQLHEDITGLADLASFKDLRPLLMAILLTTATRPDRLFDCIVKAGDGELDAIKELVEHIEHDVIAKLLANSGISKADKKAVKDLFSTKAFEPILNGEKTGEDLTIQFMPARGLMLEASGHIANTCWAEGVGTISAENPNIDAVIMTQQEKGTTQFVGASLLIHTTDVTGRPLLVARGFNPSQGLLNKVDNSQLTEKFMDYVSEIALKDGRQAAFVIDDHTGGSASNRPSIFRILESKKAGMKQRIVPLDDTVFNGYDITQHVYSR